jgi:hypothetical protein
MAPDEVDLVRSFRSDIPGPSTDAWSRARAAVAGESGGAHRRLRNGHRTTRRWPLTVGVVGAVCGAAALASVLVPGGSRTAFAGWSPIPAYATAERTATTQDHCQASLATLGQGHWTQLATDVRGPYTLAVYERAGTLASCFAGPSFTTTQAESLTLSRGGMMVSAQGATPPTPGFFPGVLSGGDIEQILVSHDSQAGVGSYTLAEGRLEPTASAVTLVLSDGEDVTATTGLGWLVAWWPGRLDVTAAQITAAGGTTTTPLTRAPSPTLPPLRGRGSEGGVRPVPVNGSEGMQSGPGGGG